MHRKLLLLIPASRAHYVTGTSVEVCNCSNIIKGGNRILAVGGWLDLSLYTSHLLPWISNIQWICAIVSCVKGSVVNISVACELQQHSQMWSSRCWNVDHKVWFSNVKFWVFECGPQSLVHKCIFLKITEDKCLCYRVHALDNAFSRELGALFRDTEYIKGHPNSYDVDPLPFHHHLITFRFEIPL